MTEELNGVELAEPDLGNPLTAELGSDNIVRETALACFDFFKAAARIVRDYRGKPGFAHDCMLLALGWYPILGVDNQTDLAKRWQCTKANVNNLVKKFEGKGYLNLPPASGQRKESGCATMATARKRQLNERTKSASKKLRT